MPLSPEEIAAKRFLVALRGYDKDEVDAYLTEVAAEVRDLLRLIDDGGQTGVDDASFRDLGTQIEAIARAATAAARESRLHAEREAESRLAAATEEAAELRRQAKDEIARERSEWEAERAALRSADDQERARIAAASRLAAEQEAAALRAAMRQTVEKTRQVLTDRLGSALKQLEEAIPKADDAGAPDEHRPETSEP